MSVCCETCLVPGIVLNIKDKVCTCLLESRRWFAIFSKVTEGLVLIDLAKFQGNGFFPEVVLGCIVEPLGVLPVTRYFVSALESWSTAEGSKLGLVDVTQQLLLVLGNPPKPFSSGFVEWAIFVGMLGWHCWAVLGNHSKRF